MRTARVAVLLFFAVTGSACGGERVATDGGAPAPEAGADGAAWAPLELGQIGAPVTLGGSFQFAEGPAWDAARGALLFSDIDADTIFQLRPPESVTVFRAPSHKSNGLAFDRDGLLLAAEHGSRSVTRTLADGTIATIADAWGGKRLNSPNDLVVRSDGTIYFTDPTYGLGSTPSELGFTGLYRIDPAGVLRLEAQVDGQPNGLDFAPGEQTLYVAATDANQILKLTVAPSGALSDPRKLADVQAPDGLAVDRAGNLYVAALAGGSGAVVVITATGETLGAIPLAQHPTNCGFGGADAKTLYVTARTALVRISVPIPGR